MKPGRRVAWLAVLLALMTISGAALGILMLRQTALEQALHRLRDTVAAQARLIEALSRYETSATILDQVRDAWERFHGFGKSGELVLGCRQGEDIRILLRRGQGAMEESLSVGAKAGLAEPMRRALAGKSGTMVGLDDRGIEVLAAYEPVRGQGLGIVAKLDYQEFLAPFSVAVATTAALVLLMTGVGAYLLFRLTEPLLRRLSRSEKAARSLFEEAPDAVFLVDAGTGKIVQANRAAARLVGRPLGEILGLSYLDLHPEEVRESLSRRWPKHLADLRQGVGPSVLETEVERADGSRVPVEVATELVRGEGKESLQAVFRDISQRRKAEERFRLAVEGTADGLWDWSDIHSERGWWSRRTYQLFGYREGEIEATVSSFRKMLHPEDRQRVFWAFRNHLQRRGPFDVEFRLRTRSGEYRWFRVRGRAQWNAAGQAVRISGSLTDIHEKKVIEQSLTRSEHRYRTLFEQSRDAIYVTSREGRIVDLNPAAVELFGFKNREEALGSRVLDLYCDPTDRRRFQEAVEQGGGVRDFEVRQRRRDGREMVCLETAVVQRDSQGRVVGYQGMVRDVTERRRILRRLRESEQRFREVFENADIGIVLLDEELKILAANPRFCDTLGYGSEELKRRKITELTHPEDSQLHWDMHRRLMSGATKRFQLEKRYLRKDGKVIWGRVTATLVRDEHGATRFFLGMIEDITQIRKAQQALRESEMRYRSVVEAASDAVLVMDSDLRICSWNRAAERIFGYRAGEIMGQPLETLVPREHLSAHLQGVERLHTGSAALPSDVLKATALRKDKTVLDVELSLSTWEGESGRQYGAIVRDVSERIRAEEERRRLETELQQAQKMELVGRLAGGVAHDFNNILTGIRGYTDFVIERLADRPEVLADAQEVRRLAERAGDLTRQLLAFSRRQEMKPSVFSFHELVTDLIKMLRRLIGEDIHLEFLPQAERDTIRGDAAQLEQVLVNLAVNARDAMPHGGDLRIRTSNEVRAGDPGGQPCLAIRVEDTGCGMDEQVEPHVFEPFFTTKEVGQGSGLGLSTAYGVIEGHGGSIRVERTSSEGTTFLIELPLARGKKTSEREGKPLPQVSGAGERILVVEDEASVRRFVGRVLRGHGYRVSTAEDPVAARKYLKRPLDLLITDMVMPGGSGPDLYRQASSLQPGLRVLFISGYAPERSGPKGEGEKKMPFLAKPFSAAELLRTVREVLDSKPVP